MVSMAILPTPALPGLSNERDKNNSVDKLSIRNNVQTANLNSDINLNDSIQSPSCKIMLQTALKKAQSAVEYDNINDFTNALNCYREALDLITNVLETSPTFRSNPRLINIQSSYIERVSLLSNLVSPKKELLSITSNMSYEAPHLKENLETYKKEIEKDQLFLGSQEDISTFISDEEDNSFNSTINNNMPESSSTNVIMDRSNFSNNSTLHTHPETKRISTKTKFNDSYNLLPNSRFSMPNFAGYKYSPIASPETVLLESNKLLKTDRRRSMPPTSFSTPTSSNSHSHSASVSRNSPDTQSSRHSLSIIYEKDISYNPAHRSWDLTPNGILPNDNHKVIPYPLEQNNNTSIFNQKSILQKCNGELVMPRKEIISSFNSRNVNLSIAPRPSSFLLASSKVVDMAVSSQALSSHKSRQYNLITIQRVFREEPSENCVFETPPVSNEFRIFWLMRSLECSMTVGGYLSKKLYMPRSVWHQSGVRLQSLEVKIHSCEMVSEYLVRFKEIDISDTNQILKELEGLDSLLNSVQNNLARKLNFIEPLKRTQSSAFASLGNKISKSVEKIQLSYLKIKTDSSSMYIDSLVKLFKASQFLEKWYQHFVALPPIQSSNIQIVARLNRVNGFLSNSICSFVLRDMSIMLAKYLKRLKLSINE